MFEIHKNIVCVKGSALIAREGNPDGIVSASLIKKWQLNNKEITVRRACYGQSLLLNFSMLPGQYRDMIVSKHGDPKEAAASKSFRDRIVPDAKAITFFDAYRLADGRELPDEAKREYAANASVLNAVDAVYAVSKSMRSKLGDTSSKGFWANALRAVNEVRTELNHTLPATEVTLSRKYAKFIKEGYNGLISGKYCNENSRKVNDKVEHLIKSIYTMTDQPFAGTVHVRYQLFLAGALKVVDGRTGELYDPKDYYENGQPITISESTVWNYLNKPENRAVVDRVRMGGHRYNNVHRPHHHRHAPQFSFSKVSMDDRDLPRKCNNGKWVKAYYAYDVTSTCVIGYSYSKDKNEALFLDCMRDMFRLIERERFGMPMEVEVEHHLVSNFKEELDEIFPFVRWCNPGNSQEKRAEHFNRAKKYGIEKKNHGGIGRWWSKHEAYTVDRDKKGDEFVDKKMFEYDKLVADDMADITEYNNALHPNQKRYPGKSRWQVLVENMNPNSPEISKRVVCKAIGVKTQTSIRRNQYVTVRERKYQIENVQVLEKLQPNNYSVDAYYIPDAEGMIHEVFVYQHGVYLCRCEAITTYNESTAERTDADYAAYQKQSAKVSEFDAYVKKGKEELAKAVIVKSETLNEALKEAEKTEVYVEHVEKAPTADELIDNASIDEDRDAVDDL